MPLWAIYLLGLTPGYIYIIYAIYKFFKEYGELF